MDGDRVDRLPGLEDPLGGGEDVAVPGHGEVLGAQQRQRLLGQATGEQDRAERGGLRRRVGGQALGWVVVVVVIVGAPGWCGR